MSKLFGKVAKSVFPFALIVKIVPEGTDRLIVTVWDNNRDRTNKNGKRTKTYELKFENADDRDEANRVITSLRTYVLPLQSQALSGTSSVLPLH